MGAFKYYVPGTGWVTIPSGGVGEDLAALEAANNSSVLVGINSVPPTVAEMNSAVAQATAGSSALRTQVLAEVNGDTAIDLSMGRNIHIASTSAAWTPLFVNVPTGGVTVHLSINVSNDDDECSIPDVIWYGTAPVTADWDAGETNVIRLTKLPFVDKWVAEWVYNGATPGTPSVTPVTLTAQYSTSPTRSTPSNLGSATLPAGDVYVFFGPASNTDIASMRVFANHTGDLPAKGSEGATFVRNIVGAPYDLIGTAAGGSALPWDTTVDPTGNNNEEFDPNGSNTITVEATWIDGQVTTNTFTFSTANAPIGSDPTITHTSTTYSDARSSHTVTIPDGVDRAVVVMATYLDFPYTESTQILTGMTIGGTAMTKITAATKDAAIDEGLGQFVAYATEADLSTGSMTLVPSFSSSPGTYSSIIYDVFVLTNVSSPVFAGDSDYANQPDETLSNLAPSLASVPANSILLTVAGTSGDLTNPVCDIGTMQTTKTHPTGPIGETRASIVTDSGTLGTKTATWDVYGRCVAALVYVDFVASSGGGGVTPIVPGTPSVSLSVAAGDNLIDATWSATADAVSYELRHGSTNPIASAPITGVTSPYRIAGLAASTLRYVQVRAKSSTGDYSAWSTIQSATPTGSVAPPPTFSGKYLVSYDHRDVTMSEGYGSYSAPDLWMPRGWSRVNPGADLANDSQLATIVDDTIVSRALNWYEGSTLTPFYEEAGPRLIVSYKLSAGSAGMNYFWLPIEDRIATILDTAKTGSTGTYNRDATLIALARSINKLHYSASGKSYDGKKVVFLSVAHETNGFWSTNGYMGNTPEMIGRPEFNNPSVAVWGAPMAAALQRLHDTGAQDDIHRLACERVCDILWDPAYGGHPDIIIGATPSAGGESNPTGEGAGGLGHGWIESAFPDRPLDFVCPTLYNRPWYPGSAGAATSEGVTYSGSGDYNDPANWNRDEGWLEVENEFINSKYGCPTGLLEFSSSFAIAGELTPGYGGSVSDQSAWMFSKRILETSLGSGTGNAENGLAFVQHWGFLRWASSDSAIPGGTGGTYNVLEGHWGRYPNNWTDMSSTAKPSWGVGSGQYPNTLAYYKSQFPKP